MRGNHWLTSNPNELVNARVRGTSRKTAANVISDEAEQESGKEF